LAEGDAAKFNDLKSITFWRFLFMWNEKLKILDKKNRQLAKKK
jgi:hypothetical protein